MTRTLTLRREALAALSDGDLGGVAAAGARWSDAGLTCPLATCYRYLTIARGYDCSTFPLCDAARGD